MTKQYEHKDLMPILQSGLGMLDLKLSQTAQEKIIEYIMLLHKWNKTYNLTAVRNPKLILIRHIFDSLAIAPYILGSNVLDFGTGAGLPGIPLALALPDKNFVLLDSSNKKTFFLNHVLLTLGIKNANVMTKRIESFNFSLGFATITTRATTTLSDIIDKTSHLVKENGQILAMKGKYPTKELEEVTKKVEVHRIKVPYLDEERHLVKVFL